MKVRDLIDFNPDAELVVNINGERIPITGVYSWAAYPGEGDENNPRDIAREKRLTLQVTLKTDSSCSEEEAACSSGTHSEESFEDGVISEIARVSCWDTESITPEKHLVEDLEIDDLDMVELAITLESRFKIYELPDSFGIQSLHTVQDVIDEVRKYLPETV